MSSNYKVPLTPEQQAILAEIPVVPKPIGQMLADYYQDKMKQPNIHQDNPNSSGCAMSAISGISSSTVDEQIGDLNNRVRQLMLRIERLELHTHNQAGEAVVKLPLASLLS
jgi:hypothetical protein